MVLMNTDCECIDHTRLLAKSSKKRASNYLRIRWRRLGACLTSPERTYIRGLERSSIRALRPGPTLFFDPDAIGQSNGFRKRVELPGMLGRENGKLPASGSQQVDLDLASIDFAGLSPDQTGLLATRHKGNDAMRLRLETLGNFADRCPVPVRETLGMKQELILQRSDAFSACSIFTESQEASQFEPEVR